MRGSYWNPYPEVTPLFQTLCQSEGVTRLHQCRRGMEVFSQNDRANSFFFLGSGRVKIFRKAGGDREILLDVIGPGEIFGEHAFEPEALRGVSAEVLEDGDIFIIPREHFVQYCRIHPEIVHWLFTMILRRQRALAWKLELLAFHDVEQRILRSLEHLAGAFGEQRTGSEWTIRLSQKELAGLVGSTRETTSTALNELSRRGLVSLARRQLVVPSLEKVRAEIGSAGSAHSA